MLFNSWGYILFLSIVVMIYWLIKPSWRVYLLCIMSLAFYSMWKWQFTGLILLSSIIDFTCSKNISKTDEISKKKLWLSISLICNLGLLVYFKYTYFILDNLFYVFKNNNIMTLKNVLNIILPLGISFYTFQTISYTIDIYRGVSKPIQSFIHFLTYVSFWPQLIAGPVLRVGEVIPQIEVPRKFKSEDVSEGIYRVLIGLFKKVCIADVVSKFVNPIFNGDIARLNAYDVWVGATLFGFQIYMDFSAYSDIAIGSARMLGIKFPENFNFPYLARSPRDFWKRWHISLSAWIRDYLYLPLTGQKFETKSVGGLATSTLQNKNFALFLTWFIMGLWHGAAWTFAFWGIYHSMLIFLYRKIPILDKIQEKSKALSWGLMLMLTMLGWIPFRAKDLDQTFTMFAKVLNPFQYSLTGRTIDGYTYLFAATVVIGMLLTKLIQEKAPEYLKTKSAFTIFRIAVLTFFIISYLKPVEQFIYFQF
jgi:alginate O-acetyltransferase complex protein AlgI